MIFLPFILLVLSLGVIVWFIIRVYSQLLLLDVESLPHVKKSRKKDIFIRKKAEKESERLYTKLQKILQPLIQAGKEVQLSFRKLVGNIEHKAIMEEKKHGKSLSTEERQQRRQTSRQLVAEASTDISQDDFETAEKKFLAAIKHDSKNKDAYKGLADVYIRQGNKQEAKETYLFVLQLDTHDEEVYLKLGELAEEEGRVESAVEYYEQAVIINPHNPQRFVKIFDLLFEIQQYETALEAIIQALSLEPQNPKYLDNFVETSILLGRKDLAEDGYKQLRMINPENQKLISFRQRIDDL